MAVGGAVGGHSCTICMYRPGGEEVFSPDVTGSLGSLRSYYGDAEDNVD